MSVWLRYYANRMQLVRSLGLMELDERGRWIDRPLDEILASLLTQGDCEPSGLPPSIPREYWQLTEPSPEPGRPRRSPSDRGPVDLPIRSVPGQDDLELLPPVVPSP